VQSHLGLLIAQQGGLRGEHIEIRIETGLIPRSGDIDVSLRSLHRLGLLCELLRGHTQRRNIVLDLLKCGQQGFLISGDTGIISRGVLSYRGIAQTGIEDYLGREAPSDQKSAGSENNFVIADD
jgi:hypothetical protein